MSKTKIKRVTLALSFEAGDIQTTSVQMPIHTYRGPNGMMTHVHTGEMKVSFVTKRGEFSITTQDKKMQKQLEAFLYKSDLETKI